MDPWTDGSHALEEHLEHRMRAQERQLAWVRLGMVGLAAAYLLLVVPDLPGIGVLLGVLGVVAAWSLLVFWLLRRFPAREVGLLSNVVVMAAVRTSTSSTASSSSAPPSGSASAHRSGRRWS